MVAKRNPKRSAAKKTAPTKINKAWAKPARKTSKNTSEQPKTLWKSLDSKTRQELMELFQTNKKDYSLYIAEGMPPRRAFCFVKQSIEKRQQQLSVEVKRHFQLLDTKFSSYQKRKNKSDASLRPKQEPKADPAGEPVSPSAHQAPVADQPDVHMVETSNAGQRKGKKKGGADTGSYGDAELIRRVELRRLFQEAGLNIDSFDVKDGNINKLLNFVCRLEKDRDQASKDAAEWKELAEKLKADKEQLEAQLEGVFGGIQVLCDLVQPSRIDWDAELAKYLKQGKAQGIKPATQKNLNAYIGPWVKHLRERKLIASSSILKNYIESRLGLSVASSKKKVAKEIIKFTSVVSPSIKLVYNMPPIGKASSDRLVMQNEVYETCRQELVTQIKANLQKTKGRTKEDHHQLVALAGASVMFNTGCRPTEAAYIVSQFINCFSRWRSSAGGGELVGAIRDPKFKINVPASATKTNRNYVFYLDDQKDGEFLYEIRSVVVASFNHVSNLMSVDWDPKPIIGGAIRYRHNGIVKISCQRLEHDAPTVQCDCNKYTPKHVRRLFATEWVRTATICEMVGHKPAPPNPLQHVANSSVTRKIYAAVGADDQNQAFEIIKSLSTNFKTLAGFRLRFQVAIQKYMQDTQASQVRQETQPVGLGRQQDKKNKNKMI